MSTNVPREAIWMMALFVAFMLIGLAVALVVPRLFGHENALQPVSPPASPPPAFMRTPGP